MVDEAAPGDDGEIRYVLVPVPREFVLDVMRWVLFRAPDSDVEREARDTVRVAEWLKTVDEVEHGLLLYLARRAVLGEPPMRLTEVSADLDTDPGAVTASAVRLNRSFGRDLIELAHETSVGALGKVVFINFVCFLV
jgi:hypothetical protein